MSKACAICSREFESNSNRQKFCVSCREKKNTCEECGQLFVVKANSSGRWCSRACWAKAKSILGRYTCRVCGRDFKPLRAEQVTCSRQCAAVYVKQRSVERRLMKRCVVCESEFDATYHRQQQMCSIECRGRFRSMPRQRCERCGKQMDTTNSSYRKQRFCSTECRRTPVGTEKTTTNGYVTVFMPDHPHAQRTGYVMKHRHVVEQQIGRLLQPNERVHHKNGQRDDNRPENLELWRIKGKDPAGVRATDYHCPGCSCPG